jgi:hypothetical protein
LFNTQIKKFFDSGAKKTLVQRQEVLCELEENEVLIRLETIKNKQYTSMAMKPADI